jgi:hypothetical protein
MMLGNFLYTWGIGKLEYLSFHLIITTAILNVAMLLTSSFGRDEKEVKHKMR